MNGNTLKLLGFNEVVVIITKGCKHPQLARIARISKHISTYVDSKEEEISYSYAVRTYNYQVNPFENFNGCDSSYLDWSEIEEFMTIDDFKVNFEYYMGEVFKLELV